MFRKLWNLSLVAESRGIGVTKILAPTSRYAQGGKHFSSNEKDDSPKPEQIFKHERHNMYVCWHPEVPFPYEMTKPIDVNAPVTESNLKVQALLPVREAFRKKSQKTMIQELIKLTYSTKHRFYGMHGKQKRAFLREMDPNKQKRNRDYL